MSPMNNKLMVPQARIPLYYHTKPAYWPLWQQHIHAVNATAVVADTLTTPTGVYPGSGAFIGGVLLPDGRVYCIPRNATSARIYDPVTDTLTTPTGVHPGSFAFAGGVLLPDGRVYCIPHSATSARLYGGGQSYSIRFLLSGFVNKL